MRKLFLGLVAVLFLATSAFAFTSGEYGYQHVETCYAIGIPALTSGDVVRLTTVQDTTRTMVWPGREVTGGSVNGSDIFGVYVGTTNYSAAEMVTGQWIPVQTMGYVPRINISTVAGANQTTAGCGLCMSTKATDGVTGSLKAVDASNLTATATGNVVCFSATTGNTESAYSAGFLR